MAESQGKKVFRIQLSVSIVLLLLTLSGVSLLASFYLGMITGKSMQRPSENYSEETETHTVETHIHRLRKKILDKFDDNDFIKNNKKGYYI